MFNVSNALIQAVLQSKMIYQDFSQRCNSVKERLHEISKILKGQFANRAYEPNDRYHDQAASARSERGWWESVCRGWQEFNIGQVLIQSVLKSEVVYKDFFH